MDGKVTTWLGQQISPPKKKRLESPGNMPWGAPSIVLLPPPPRIPPGPLPLWTYLHPSPPSFAASSHLYSCCPSVTPCCCHHEHSQIAEIHGCRSSNSRRVNYIKPDPKIPKEPRKKKNSRRERRISEPSTEDLARTYTGRDREIAEEFIAIAMDRSRKRSRASSIGGYSREAY